MNLDSIIASKIFTKFCLESLEKSRLSCHDPKRNMSKISFMNYGKLAKNRVPHIVAAGRSELQKEVEKLIFFDICQKLNITPADHVLDIGCGPGNITIPISFICKKMVAIDHPNTIKKLSIRYSDHDSFELIGGNFLNFDIENKFNKIIIYSVIQYLSNIKEVLAFILKAMALVEPGGSILIGDIPNSTKKARFLKSDYGKIFVVEWNKNIENNPLEFDIKQDDDNLQVELNDKTILWLVGNIREKGFNAELISQPSSLPFGHTREDILITHPEYC